MISAQSAREYVHLLEANIGRCASIEPEDRTIVPSRFDKDRNVWIVMRGFDDAANLFGDPVAAQPFELVQGGRIKLEVRVRELREKRSSNVEVAAYRVTFLDIPENPNKIGQLRFDRPGGQQRGVGWEDDLQDNPQHPHSHLHVNFLAEGANDLRLPTGEVCPVVLMRAFDFWYYQTFVT